MRHLSKIAGLVAMVLLSACATKQEPVGGAPGMQLASVTGLPTPTLADYTPDAMQAMVRPLDVVVVDVFGVEELSRQLQVSANGTLLYPLIGSVQAAGRTPEELAYEIQSRLRNGYVRDPDVTLRIASRSEQLVTVGGEVETPGRFPVEGPITLMEAVALGGGMDEYAKRDEVLVFRTVGEERYIGVYNVEGIERGNYADPMIYPNDIVMVGDSPGRRRLESIIQIATAISSPLVVLERVINSN